MERYVRHMPLLLLLLPGIGGAGPGTCIGAHAPEPGQVLRVAAGAVEEEEEEVEGAAKLRGDLHAIC